MTSGTPSNSAPPAETAGRNAYLDQVVILRRLIVSIAAGVAVTLVCTIPAIYFWTAYHYEIARIEGEATRTAARISRFVYSKPDLWKYSEHTLRALAAASAEGDKRVLNQVLDLNGELLTEAGNGPPNGLLAATAPIFDGPHRRGSVRSVESLRPVAVSTGLVGLIGCVLALAIFIALRILPLRALGIALERIDLIQSELSDRVADLESAKGRLEDQGIKLQNAARDLALARDEAVAANRAKSEFLANMSHELRTPLNAIIGFSDILKLEMHGPLGTPTYSEYAADINNSGQHLLELINDVLDLSKIEFSASEINEEKFQIPEVVNAVVRLVRDRAAKGGVDVSVTYRCDPPALNADRRKLKQILANLLTNAIKFTDAGGKIALTVWRGDDGGCTVEVTDTGIGMAPDDIPRALAPFQQIDSDLDRKYEGSGLGLPLVKAMVELHGGTLELQSEPGVGTTAAVHLPAARVLASTTVQPALAQTAG